MSISFLALQFIFIISSVMAFNCTSPWKALHGKSCYRMFYNEWLSWNEAQIHCEMTNGAHLISLDSAQEEKAIADLMKKKYTFNIWIGATDFGNEGNWKWISTGKNVQYTNWSQGQPGRNFFKNCAYYGHYSHYKWSTEACDALHHFMCEK